MTDINDTLDTTERISILYVDDDLDLLIIWKKILEKTNLFRVDIAISADEGLQKIDKESYDCIISDYQMPKMDGIQFLKSIREKNLNIPVIIFTVLHHEKEKIESFTNDSTFFLEKITDVQSQIASITQIVFTALRYCDEMSK